MRWGIHEPEALEYEHAVQRGAIVLTVNVSNERALEVVTDILHPAGGKAYGDA